MDIKKIDKNYHTLELQNTENTCFYTVPNNNINLYGVIPPTKEEPYFKRLPKNKASKVSQNVETLVKHTSGGRIRFKTNSDFLSIKAILHETCKVPHMASTNSLGFDIYTKKEGDSYRYASIVFADLEKTEKCEGTVFLGECETREITVNFPCYGGVKNIEIGLNKNAFIKPADNYLNKEPVLVYGSSITQGACASRPGNTYIASLSKLLNLDFYNLGFSGSCLAEPEMLNIINSFKMSAFVFDYDHNAPTAEYLNNTHEKFFKGFREVNPTVPVIFLTAPYAHKTEEDTERRNIIYKTYKNALNNNDKNVYFIDGLEIFNDEFKDNVSVDEIHPNDLGFYFMAKALKPIFKKIFIK